MLDYTEIIKSINSILRTTGIDIISNTTMDNFPKPCFFTKLIVLEDNADNNMIDNHLNIIIHYFGSTKTEIENYKILNKLRRLFINKLEVNERVLTIYDKDYEMENEFLQFKFELKYTDTLDIEETTEVADEIIIKNEVL